MYASQCNVHLRSALPLRCTLQARIFVRRTHMKRTEAHNNILTVLHYENKLSWSSNLRFTTMNILFSLVFELRHGHMLIQLRAGSVLETSGSADSSQLPWCKNIRFLLCYLFRHKPTILQQEQWHCAQTCAETKASAEVERECNEVMGSLCNLWVIGSTPN